MAAGEEVEGEVQQSACSELQVPMGVELYKVLLESLPTGLREVVVLLPALLRV